jgi:protein arginine kinase
MAKPELFQARWYEHGGIDLDVVISSRVRLARNLKTFPFPGKMTPAEENHVQELVLDALRGEVEEYELSFVDLASIPPLERKALVEEGLVSQAYSLEPFRAFALSHDASICVVPNDIDHVRLSAYSSGFDLLSPFARLDALDDKLDGPLPYAASLELGYLTTELSSLGTGLRASVLLHLPALNDSGLIEKALKSIMNEGLGVRGFYGGEGQSSGALYQISNLSSLGESESTILNRVSQAVIKVVQYERLAREELAEKDHERFMDLVARSYAALRYAHVLGVSECFELLSRFRLGVALGWISGCSLEEINALYYGMQRASLQLGQGLADDAVKDTQFDVLRARVMRDFARKAAMQGVD